MRQRVVLDRFRSTDGATKLRETQRTGTALGRFSKPHEPHWGGIIPDSQLEALVAYIKTLKTG